MSYKLLFFTILFGLIGVGAGQTPAPIGDEATAKLEKNAVEFLRETSADVGQLRTMENRISFNSELASLMWFHDEKEAKAMYGEVVSDFKQLLLQFDSQMNSVPDDDDSPTGGLFGGYGKNKVERKFRIAMAVRKQIAMSLAEHAPDLAYNFFYDSLNLISNPQFRKETETSDKYFEYQLMNQIAEADAAKAAEYGKESIRGGLDGSHIDLLRKIYAKDPAAGIAFGAAILSRLKSDKAGVKNVYFYSSLLSFGSENLEKSKKPGGKKPVYDRNDLRDVAEQFAEVLLDGKGDDDRYSAMGYADDIDKYAPGKGAQIRSKFKIATNGVNSGTYTAIGNRAVNAATTNGYGSADPGIASNSNTPVDRSRAALEEREKVEKQMIEDVKNLGTKPLAKEERDKVIANVRKIISQTPGKDKKITALSLLAAQVAHAGDKELADEIMLDADRLVNPQPKNYQDFLLTWMLASGYAEANPDKAFPLLESTIFKANETISAFVKVAEFMDVNDEFIDSGEVQVGMFGGSMIREITGELGLASSTIRSLSKADFGKTRNLTNTFDRPEIRVLAKMMVLRAVLDKGKERKGLNSTPLDDGVGG